jgi:7-alpha-hydroxysteroid dehydrogenase
VVPDFVNQPLSAFSLAGQVALVTGGGRGIGAVIARTFAAAGADVVISSRTESQLVETAELIRGTGRRVEPIVADVTDEAQVAAMVERSMSAFGRIDILVNNAGRISGWKRVLDMTRAEWDDALATNLTSAFLVSRAVAPHMLAAGRGAIVSTGSISGRRGQKTMANYGAAKAALTNLTKSLAVEWAPAIRVNCIAAGVINWDDAGMFETAEQVTRFAKRTKLGRLGTREDVALAALYLCSGAGAWVTGTTLDLNGGEWMGA